jgi:hypothetical protein
MQLITSDQRRTALLKRLGIIAFVIIAMSGVVAAQPTTNPICDSDSSLSALQPVLNGALQVSIFVGVSGAVVAFFGGTAIESLPVSAQRREEAKNLQQRTRGAALKLLFGGAIISFILSGVFDVSCLSLLPF